MANEFAHFSCCRSPLPDLSAFIVLFLPCFFAFCSLFFVHSIMGKDKSRQTLCISSVVTTLCYLFYMALTCNVL